MQAVQLTLSGASAWRLPEAMVPCINAVMLDSDEAAACPAPKPISGILVGPAAIQAYKKLRDAQPPISEQVPLVFENTISPAVIDCGETQMEATVYDGVDGHIAHEMGEDTLFVTIHSCDASGRHEALQRLAGRRVRVTVELLEG